MPLLGEYSWSETDDHIEVAIALKGPRKKVDCFTASNILKVSYAPYLLDLNLYGEIDEESSRAVLKRGTLKVCLAKKISQPWGQLCFEGSKGEIKQRRQKALRERDEMVQKQKEKAAANKVEEDRMFFQKQMATEEREQRRIDLIKATEKKQAENAMHDTFSRLRPDKSREQSSNMQFKEENDALLSDNTPNSDCDSLKEIICPDQELQNCKEDAEAEFEVPPPRQVAHTSFRHTPRLFKTPSRESTMKQEREFIMKNRSNLKKNVLLNNVDIGDVDPVWLTSKGDDFYSKGDFCSAINAYSEALETDGTMVHALGSRAACYLRLREGACCIKDCLEALKLDDGIVDLEEHTQFQKSIHTHLAMAYCLVEKHSDGIEHFTAAKHLDKTDDVSTESISYLKICAEVIELKTKADSCFAEGNLLKAAEFYTKALSVDEDNVRVLMNRAACHLALGIHTECIDDCTRALKTLKVKPDSSCLLLATVLFPTESVQRKWVVTLLCRRAAAKGLSSNFQGASKDLDEARLAVRPQDGIDVEAVMNSICSKKN